MGQNPDDHGFVWSDKPHCRPCESTSHVSCTAYTIQHMHSRSCLAKEDVISGLFLT